MAALRGKFKFTVGNIDTTYTAVYNPVGDYYVATWDSGTGKRTLVYSSRTVDDNIDSGAWRVQR